MDAMIVSSWVSESGSGTSVKKTLAVPAGMASALFSNVTPEGVTWAV